MHVSCLHLHSARALLSERCGFKRGLRGCGRIDILNQSIRDGACQNYSHKFNYTRLVSN